VDDHPLVREWLTTLIHQQPDLMVCGEAESASQALEGISTQKPDVAIVDISLKGASGIELIKNLKSLRPSVAIIVLTMHDESLYAERALRAGARGYIMKRETAKRIIAAIRDVLEGKLYVSERLTKLFAEKFVVGQTTTVSSPIEQLSDRELEVFQLYGQGCETRQIAESLNVSMKTVQAYCARIKEKLRLSNATELLREAIRWHESQQAK
jgi:DNA-binding NarL/FixJ family response regulator